MKHLTLGAVRMPKRIVKLITMRGRRDAQDHQSAAIAAIVGTVTFWTIVTHVKSNAAHVQATEASAPVSPHEIMVKQGTSIPVEYFAHPF